MKKQALILLTLAITLVGCTSQTKIYIHFKFIKDSKNIKSLHVNFRNDSNSDLMVLSMGKIRKVGRQHPCGAIRLDDFTKISSHVEGDCNINRGSRLFTFQEIEPFNRIDYLTLKRELENRPWFKDSDDLFTYMEPLQNSSTAFPSFILIKAGETTVVKYAIDSNLTQDDQGAYEVFWADKEEIDKTLSPRNDNKFKLREALSNIQVYSLYDGSIAVEPLIVNL